MLFNLENACATYQRLVNKVFVDKIGQTMMVYMDDMLVKSSTNEQHVQDLKETFSLLRLFNMSLNLEKFTFEVETRNFLGFMVL